MFHYVDKDGRRQAESFTPEQRTADRALLDAFGTLERVAADDRDPNAAAHAPVVQTCLGLLPQLPPNRAEHHARELERIGVKLPKPKAAAKPATDNKDDGGSK